MDREVGDGIWTWNGIIEYRAHGKKYVGGEIFQTEMGYGGENIKVTDLNRTGMGGWGME